MESLNFPTIIITQNLKTSENQETNTYASTFWSRTPISILDTNLRHFQVPLILTNSHINVLLVSMGLNNRYCVRNFEIDSSLLTYVNFVVFSSSLPTDISELQCRITEAFASVTRDTMTKFLLRYSYLAFPYIPYFN